MEKVNVNKSKLSPFHILKNLDKGIIGDIVLKKYNREDELLESGRDLQIKALADDVVATGIHYVLQKCTKPILVRLIQDEKLNKDKNSTKPVIIEKLELTVNERGISSFLKDFDVEVVKTVAKKLFKVSEEKKEELLAKIEEESYLQGLTKFFEQFPVNDLKEWCEKLDIAVHSSSKKRLARAIIFGEDLGQLNQRSYTTAKPSGDKPEKIEKGITKEVLKEHFTVTELREYCEDNDIKKGGVKDELVDRIVAFLNGEKVEKMKRGVKRGKKKNDDEDYSEGDNPSKKRKISDNNEEDDNSESELSNDAEMEDNGGDEESDNKNGDNNDAAAAAKVKKEEKNDDNKDENNDNNDEKEENKGDKTKKENNDEKEDD